MSGQRLVDDREQEPVLLRPILCPWQFVQSEAGEATVGALAVSEQQRQILSPHRVGKRAARQRHDIEEHVRSAVAEVELKPMVVTADGEDIGHRVYLKHWTAALPRAWLCREAGAFFFFFAPKRMRRTAGDE